MFFTWNFYFNFEIVFQVTRLLTEKGSEVALLSSSAKSGQNVHKKYLRVMPGSSTDKHGKNKVHRFYKAEGFGTKMVSKELGGYW